MTLHFVARLALKRQKMIRNGAGDERNLSSLSAYEVQRGGLSHDSDLPKMPGARC
jgi:hypothetical protein